jgi:hypothetical protein
LDPFAPAAVPTTIQPATVQLDPFAVVPPPVPAQHAPVPAPLRGPGAATHKPSDPFADLLK